jgi:hypothetical protein
MKLKFSIQIKKKSTELSDFIKIRQVGAELFHMDRRKDGQTDKHDEDNSRFSQFWERTED